LFGTLDIVSSHVARRLVEVGVEEGIVTGKTALGVTGRAGISGNKPGLIIEEISKLGLYDEPEKNIVFVDDGLARGAAVMARCNELNGNSQDPSGRSEAWPLHPAAKNGVRIQERIGSNNTGRKAPSRDEVLLC